MDTDHGARPIDRFLADVASERVVPAGGTVAAVAGAAGAALCEMVCIHTIGADGDPDGEGAAGLADARDDLRELRGRLLDLADADAAAVDGLVSAPADDPGATGRKRATGVPLAIAEACLAVLEGATTATERGTPRAVPDAVTGAILAHAALEAALRTVRSNLARIEDEAFVEEVARRATEIERAAERARERVGT